MKTEKDYDAALFDTLIMQKKEKEAEYSEIKNKYQTEINSIQDILNNLEEKIKTEFVKKINIEQDFELCQQNG